MTPPKTSSSGDSEKIKLIPEVMRWVAQLNKVIITGDVDKGEPGLLEDIRNIRKDLQEMKTRQVNFEELDKRVAEIEKRHALLDGEKKQKWEMINKYNLTLFGIIASQVIIMIVEWIKR